MKNGKAKPKKKRLTKKQAKFVKAIVDPKVETIKEAGEIAGFADRQHAHRTLQNTTVQNSLKHFLAKLEAAGATDELVAQRMYEGLSSKKIISGMESDIVDREQVGRYVDRIMKVKQYITGGGEEPVQDNRKQFVIVINNNEEKKESVNGNGKHNPLEDII